MIQLTTAEQRRMAMEYLQKHAIFTEYDVQTPAGTLTLLQVDNTLHFVNRGFGSMYSMTYEGLYHGNKVPPNHFVWVGEYLMRIESTSSVHTAWELDITVCEWYRLLLSRPIPVLRGTRFYLDDKLYTGKPFKGYFGDVRLRNWLLRKRKEGTVLFKTLKIVDAEGKVTMFL